MNKEKGFLISGATGNKSCKRLYGTICIILGIILLLAGAIASIYYNFKDPDMFKFCSQTLVVLGGSLLGIGVFDGIGQKIGGTGR
jgi:hypothetical protein